MPVQPEAVYRSVSKRCNHSVFHSRSMLSLNVGFRFDRAPSVSTASRGMRALPAGFPTLDTRVAPIVRTPSACFSLQTV